MLHRRCCLGKAAIDQDGDDERVAAMATPSSTACSSLQRQRWLIRPTPHLCARLVGPAAMALDAHRRRFVFVQLCSTLESRVAETSVVPAASHGGGSIVGLITRRQHRCAAAGEAGAATNQAGQGG